MTRLRALMAKATPGPWARAAFVEQTGDYAIATLCDDDDAPAFPVESIIREDDAAAIVAMRNGCEALLDVGDAAQLALDAFDTLIIRLNRENAGTMDAFRKLETARDALRSSLTKMREIENAQSSTCPNVNGDEK